MNITKTNTAMNTNWSSPKTNILAAILDLRSALASGRNAKLIKRRNEDCSFPIKEKNQDSDFRNYEFRIGHVSSRDEIQNNPNMSEFEKHLSLNYKTCYGTQEAVKQYYSTGLLSMDNIKSVGTSHLVHIEDLILFYHRIGNDCLEKIYRSQYLDENTGNEKNFFDFFNFKHGSPYAVKKFKRKLWVVVQMGDNEKKSRTPIYIHVLNVILYPTKFIPRRSVLRMPEYTNYTFRVGGVTHGFSVEFQIPKKFSFN